MQRRDFLKLSGTLLAGGALTRTAGAAEKPAASPNIILILADDLGYGDLGCYGQRLLETPNIDRLAAEGLRFTQAYAGGPVCAPSRCALMTGLHGGHGVVRDNIPHYPAYLGERDITVAEVLRGAGYRCGGVGKWSLGDAGTVGRATNQGFETWFGYLNQDHAHYYYTEYLDDDEGRLDLTGNGASREHYSHDLMAERALRFVRKHKDGPFFLYAAFTLPHFSSDEEDPDGFAVPSTEPFTGRDWDERTKKYAAMVHRLDRDVGRLTELVDELGLTENTLILFASDNGGHRDVPAPVHTGGPLRGFKSELTEGGIRVPLIARWPGVVPAGKTSDEVVAFWDFLPTFAELAGSAPPEKLDGVSIVPALKGGALEQPREYLYWDYGHCRDRYDQAVRMGRWKGIRLGIGGKVQLYDLEKDLGETTDLAAKHPDIIQRMEEIMRGAATPSPRYPVGVEYKGKPLWRKGARRPAATPDTLPS